MGFLLGLFTNVWRRNTVEDTNLYKSTVDLSFNTKTIKALFFTYDSSQFSPILCFHVKSTHFPK